MRMPKIIRACKGTTFLALSMPLTDAQKKARLSIKSRFQICR